MTPLVDIGANLTNKSFRPDLDEVLGRARDAGVGTILVTGTNVEASLAALELTKRRELYELVREIPPDRLMIETDAPYLLPAGSTPKVPRRNEPALLPQVLRAVARARGEHVDDVARHTTETARSLFAL